MVGLGLLVGAVLQRPAQAQADTARAKRDTARVRRDSARADTGKVIIPARPTADSILRDSLAKRDSLHPRAVPRDTIKAPFARAPMPVPLEIGQTLIYDRAALFATGAITVQDLLDRIPGITGFRTGWIAAPMVSAYMGDMRRIRVFVDGVELDELDPRNAGLLDLTQVQLWTFEELRIERGATEVRVYARTWRVDRTTPYSRTDVSTGDQQTNLYRGFFGRRWSGGEGLQFAAQQYGTTPPIRGSPSSDQLNMLARFGWAAHGWSFDGFAHRMSRHRGEVIPVTVLGVSIVDSVPALQSTRTDAYLRAAYGDPERGPWFQAIASSLGYTISKESFNGSGKLLPLDTVAADSLQLKRDSTLFRAQWVLTGGVTAGPLRLEAAARWRSFGDGRSLTTPSARAEFVTGPLSVSAFAEGSGPDSLARGEVTARVAPLPFVSFLGAAGTSKDRQGGDSTATINFLRGEGAIRVHGLWLGGGMLRRDSTLLLAPRVLGRPYVEVPTSAAIGVMGTIRGTLYQALRADVMGIRWNDSSGFYRPRYQTRSEVYLQTNWLSRFPSGNFGVLISVAHEYRSSTLFPVQGSSGITAISVPDARYLNFHLELKIVSALLSYQFRNIQGDPYELVPGFLMPRQTQFYGVRWEFWN